MKNDNLHKALFIFYLHLQYVVPMKIAEVKAKSKKANNNTIAFFQLLLIGYGLGQYCKDEPIDESVQEAIKMRIQDYETHTNEQDKQRLSEKWQIPSAIKVNPRDVFIAYKIFTGLLEANFDFTKDEIKVLDFDNATMQIFHKIFRYFYTFGQMSGYTLPEKQKAEIAQEFVEAEEVSSLEDENKQNRQNGQ